MDLFGMKKEEMIVYKGIMYSFEPLNIDISEAFEEPHGSLVMTHRIKGFKEYDVYLVIYAKEGSFFFGKSIPGKPNAFEVIDDEEVSKEAMNLIVNIAKNSEVEDGPKKDI